MATTAARTTSRPQPDAALLKKGVDLLLEQFDPRIVGIYLRAFNQIDETQWPALDDILRDEPRLAAEGGNFGKCLIFKDHRD